MNCATLARVCKGLAHASKGRCIFLGCVNAEGVKGLERVPESARGVYFVIANILQSSDPETMGHWVFFGKLSGRLIYFDSFNIPPGSYSEVFGRLVTEYKDKKRFLNISKRLQSSTSLVCGAYMLWLVSVLSSEGLEGTVHAIGTYFSEDRNSNDKKVLRYVYTHFRLPDCRRVFCDGVTEYLTCVKRYCADKFSPVAPSRYECHVTRLR